MSEKNLPVRLRFAPSPTGFLHFGNFRTALFGYLLAKSQGGQFILRIEDTDQSRKVEGAAEKLISVLEALGIGFDEGPHIGGPLGPYIQTERLDVYQRQTQELLDKGQAYRCFCTEERLTEMRAQQEAAKQPPRYDRLCRELDPAEAERRAFLGEPHVIRQKLPLTGEVRVFDELRGEIVFSAADLDDQVLVKSNGIPTYQLANIVDDHFMQITHVTRGAEWLSSFPKNILLYQAFGWTPPHFIHLPLILNKEGGGKLSKRRGDVFVEDFLNKGYLPEALINFCVLLGWHPKSNQELWSLAELEKEFTLSGLGASPAVFDLEKLDFFNAHYIRQLSVSELTAKCQPYLEQAALSARDSRQLEQFIALSQDRLKKLSDIAAVSAFLFNLPDYDRANLKWRKISLEESLACLRDLYAYLNEVVEDGWETKKLEELVLAWIKEQGRPNGDYLWPLRYALTGQQFSPGPFEVAAALGKNESLRRIKLALAADSQ